MNSNGNSFLPGDKPKRGLSRKMSHENCSELHERAQLSPRLKAISDTLDEWLVRMHGIFSGWAFPEEFETWLKEHGYIVVSTKVQAVLTAAEGVRQTPFYKRVALIDAVIELNEAVRNLKESEAKDETK